VQALPSITIIVAGVVIGLLLGLTGGGGSILTVPLLVYVVGLPPKVAIATSLAIVGSTSVVALAAHARAGQVAWRVGALFGMAGMTGAYAGGAAAQFFSDIALLLLFAAVMFGSAFALLGSNDRPARAGATGEAGRRRWHRICADGFVVGLVTGLVGAGGGFLVVPALALLGGLPMHVAVGTSLLVIAMKCAAGLAGYTLSSGIAIDLHAAVLIAVCACFGTIAGSRATRLVSPQTLKQGFAVFVLAVASVLVMIEGSRWLEHTYALSRAVAAAGILVGLGLSVIPGALRARRRGLAGNVH